MYWFELWPQVSAPWRLLRGLAAGVAVVLILSGCQKENEAGCFTSTGSIRAERRALQPFHTLTTYDNVTVLLVQDTETYAEVRAGQNLQEDIRLEEADGYLTIRNTSRCNWVRRYNTPREVTLHTPRLSGMFLRGEADIRTVGTFRADTLFAHLIGSGDYHLNLASTYLGMSQYELGDIYLSGTASELHHTLGGNGSLYATELPLQEVYLQTNFDSSGNAYVRPARLLAGTHAGTGTVYYAGAVPLLELGITGKGKLTSLP
ncbi:head GIN domain-containing protein [Hymenobacter tenuis]